MLYHLLLLLNLDLADGETETEGGNGRVFPSTLWLGRCWRSRPAGRAFCFPPAPIAWDFLFCDKTLLITKKPLTHLHFMDFAEGLSVTRFMDWEGEVQRGEAPAPSHRGKGGSPRGKHCPPLLSPSCMPGPPGRPRAGKVEYH